MKSSILYIILSVTLLAGYNQTNYTPKALFKEIKKISNCDKPTYEVLIINSNSTKSPLNGKYFKYNNTLPIKYAYIGRVLTCRAHGCSSSNKEKSTENAEYFDYFILFDSNGSILSVQIFNYEASHGQQITVKSWLKQFIGYNGSKELIVGKEIDAIAGATISAHNITYDISNKTTILKTHILETNK
jgi:hypothetical protein